MRSPRQHHAKGVSRPLPTVQHTACKERFSGLVMSGFNRRNHHARCCLVARRSTCCCAVAHDVWRVLNTRRGLLLPITCYLLPVTFYPLLKDDPHASETDCFGIDFRPGCQGLPCLLRQARPWPGQQYGRRFQGPGAPQGAANARRLRCTFSPVKKPAFAGFLTF